MLNMSPKYFDTAIDYLSYIAYYVFVEGWDARVVTFHGTEGSSRTVVIVRTHCNNIY